MLRTRLGVVPLVVAGALVALGASAGHAARLPSSAPEPAAAPPVSHAVLKGYEQLSANFTALPDGTATDDVECPSGTVIVSGGVEISGYLDGNENVADTYPATKTVNGVTSTYWYGAVNNATSSNVGFTVFAECAKAPKKWQIVTGQEITDPPEGQTTNLASCPSGLVVLGGGGLNVVEYNLNVNDSGPVNQGRGWSMRTNNVSSSNGSSYAYAICAQKPSAYKVVEGSEVDADGAPSTDASAACPSGTNVLGGGSASTTTADDGASEGSYPSGSSGWYVSQYDDFSDSALEAYAVCGKT